MEKIPLVEWNVQQRHPKRSWQMGDEALWISPAAEAENATALGLHPHPGVLWWNCALHHHTRPSIVERHHPVSAVQNPPVVRGDDVHHCVLDPGARRLPCRRRDLLALTSLPCRSTTT
eukprot:scaffold2262_cov262-Pinguiococcus_pyrenoidosus.AAC.12